MCMTFYDIPKKSLIQIWTDYDSFYDVNILFGENSKSKNFENIMTNDYFSYKIKVDLHIILWHLKIYIWEDTGGSSQKKIYYDICMTEERTWKGF